MGRIFAILCTLQHILVYEVNLAGNLVEMWELDEI